MKTCRKLNSTRGINRRKKMKKYLYSLDEDTWGTYEEIMDDEISGVYTLFKGERVEYAHEDFLSVYRLLDNILEEAYDIVGDYSESYLADLTSDKHKELTEVITDWLNKNAKKPNFCTVKKVTSEEVIIGES